MQPSLLVALVVVLFVVICVLLTFFLRIYAPYGNLVRSTLEWLESHHFPLSGFTRTVIDHLASAVSGGEVSLVDAHSPAERSNDQTRDRAVQLDIQRPPQAYC